MRFPRLLIPGLAAIALVGCLGATSGTPSAESPAAPVSSPSPEQSAPQVAAAPSGSFMAGEHPTQGKVKLVVKNNQRFLEFDRTFKTDSGPDLVVALHRSGNVLQTTKPPAYPLKEGDYVVLAPLQKTSGAQSYAIPSQVNLANYKSVVVWCQKFNATFGAARLSN
ncbi:hypothetical protein BST81_10735 [Leptolyngbya sp. 'hensonii']|nr:hypothetical protein BST81_10735 [Leptolyngbya sp. 'hensonii']